MGRQGDHKMSRYIALCFLILLAIAAASVGMVVAYLVSALITSWIGINILLSALAFGIICYGLLRNAAPIQEFGHPKRFAAAMSLISLFVVAAVVAAPTLSELFAPAPNNATGEVISALQEHTIALKTAQAGSGFEDLRPLKPILEGKRIVALGEATHGTREFFQMKHRMLEFLVKEMGYENFGMETSAEVGLALNDYISGGSGNSRDVLYWPWATTEVMDMLDWMRAYNADPLTARKIAFYGIDPTVGDRDRVMAENVGRLITQSGPDSKVVLWAHNAHISNCTGCMGHYLKQQFGDQAYLLGFEFDHGSFTSRMATIQTYSVGPASPAYYAYALSKTGKPIQFLDFQTMSLSPVLEEWLAKDQSSHEFQELHAIFRLVPAWHTVYTSWLKLYDGVIFIEESTPAIGLR
jgi:erythromycin esterase-like protein